MKSDRRIKGIWQKMKRGSWPVWVLAIYVLFAVMDYIPAGKDSLLDQTFSFIPVEHSYSAPFAKVHFYPDPAYGSADSRRPLQGLHILGTDVNGYDVFLNILKGARTALTLAIGTGLIVLPIGVLLGLLAGFFGGWIDDTIVWLYTTVASIPYLLFIIAFLSVYGRGIFWICLAIGLASWTELARLVRGETLKLKDQAFVRAARAAGLSRGRIIFRHILPGIYPIIIITFTLSSSAVILAESILTFIGMGVQPGTASWGLMLVESQNELMRSPAIWWPFFAASMAILPLIVSLNILSDKLRDMLDPSSQKILPGIMQTALAETNNTETSQIDSNSPDIADSDDNSQSGPLSESGESTK